MVHEKKKSGDPDFDDKVPVAEHGKVVTAGDGKIIGRISDVTGPVTLEGAHLPLVSAEEADTRPVPGEVAKEKSEVQSYTPEDVPHEEVSLADIGKGESTSTSQQSGDKAAAEASGNPPVSKTASATTKK